MKHCLMLLACWVSCVYACNGGAASTDTPAASTAGSGAAGAETGAGRDQAAAKFCAADCRRDAQCSQVQADCMSNCSQETQRWNGAFLSQLASCIESIGCEKDDPCYGQALNQLNPNFTQDPAVARCLRSANACGFDTELCPSLLALTGEARVKAVNCLGLECNGLDDCLETEGAFSP